MTNKGALHGDLASALIIVALSVYILAVAPPWGLWDLVGPGPGFFPTLYGALMLALGLALLARSLRGRASARAAVTPTGDAQAGARALEAPMREGTFAALAAWVALALSIPLMMAVGFIAGFGLLAFFLIKVIFGKPLTTSLIAAAGITAGLYLLFQIGLEVDLPVSMFGGR